MGKSKRQYSDNDKAAALAALDANGGNLRFTADVLGIPFTTLQRWKNGEGISADVPEMRTKKRDELASLFEQLVRRYIERALSDDAIADTRGKDAVIAAATALDKFQLLTDQPTGKQDDTLRIVFEYED